MWTKLESVAHVLAENHYLGPIGRGLAWQDEYGVMVVANPTARHIPLGTWLELTRWCILERGGNHGSRMWAGFIRGLRKARPDVTTLVSYSDPAVGHTGALYRACNWLWAPTWHRLRPPPSGNGAWTEGEQSSVKDRWVFPIRPDPARAEVLRVKDDAILARHPWALYTEPGGVPFKNAVVAQLVEHLPSKQGVPSSSLGHRSNSVPSESGG